MPGMPTGVALEDSWHEARLLPTTGIGGQAEQEKRATSVLLAVMRAVPDFGKSLVGDLGAPRGRIATYAEVQFRDGEGGVSIPDGAIVVEWGKKRWRALLEVKTGTAELKADQVERYVDIARGEGLDAVVTISNQLTASSKESPVAVRKAKLKRVELRHLSWWRVLTEAVVQHRHRGISDPDQAFILGELIAYLDDERSGASGFGDMGQAWVAVRDGARNQTLRAGDSQVRAVTERWEQFLDYLSLGLGQDLGRDVEVGRPRKQTREARLSELSQLLAREGTLAGRLRVPDAVGPLDIEANLQTRQVTTSVRLSAPEDRRARGRISWMLQQLKTAPADLRVSVSFVKAAETTVCLLGAAREDPGRLLSNADPKREPRSFRLALSRPLGRKRGRAAGSFVGDTRTQAIDFYRDIVQDLKAWRAPAPKLPAGHEEDDPSPQPEPPSFSSDTRDPGEGQIS